MTPRTSSRTAPLHLLLLFSIAALLPTAGAATGEVVIEVDLGADPARLEATTTPRQLADGPAVLLPFYRATQNPARETTLYAVRNNSASTLGVTFSYFEGNDGTLAVVEQSSIAPHAVRTVNVRDVPGLPFQNGAASGYLVAEAPAGSGPAAILSGDFFRVDPSASSANGGTLVDAELAECRRWSHRFLEGGGFDGGTMISFLALNGPSQGPVIAGNVYDEEGQLVAVVSIASDRPAFEVRAGDLDLPIPFGSIDWIFAGEGHGIVSTTFTAQDRFSVGTEARCIQDVESGPPAEPGEPGEPGDGSVVFELPGTFLNCNNCANWQFDMPFGERRDFSRIVVEFDVYVSGWDPFKPNGFHCLFWLNNGTRWQDMLGYLNSRGTQNRMVFQSNGPLGNPIGVEQYKSPGVQPGQTYRVHYEYDTVEKSTWYSVRDASGALVVSDAISLPQGIGPVSTSYTFIQFGSQPSDGVEALTNGWRFSNFQARFIP